MLPAKERIASSADMLTLPVSRTHAVGPIRQLGKLAEQGGLLCVEVERGCSKNMDAGALTTTKTIVMDP